MKFEAESKIFCFVCKMKFSIKIREYENSLKKAFWRVAYYFWHIFFIIFLYTTSTSHDEHNLQNNNNNKQTNTTSNKSNFTFFFYATWNFSLIPNKCQKHSLIIYFELIHIFFLSWTTTHNIQNLNIKQNERN